MSDPIRIIREPSVYLIARQQIDEDELSRFLIDNGSPQWTTDTTVAAERLVEVAGRLCYDSYAKPRPGGNKAYIDHIRESGHGCYDAETDVLTHAGWKAWPDVSMGDYFATLSASGCVEYHQPKRLVAYEYSGKMYRVDSQQVDLLVTPDHKMLACPTTTRAGRKKADESYRLFTAEELGGVSHAYRKAGSWGGGWWKACPGRDVLALLGFAIGDGSIANSRSSTISFHLRRERKIAWLRSLCARLANRGYRLYENEANDRYSVLLPDNAMDRSLFAGIYDEDREKRVPVEPNVLMGASREGLEGLYEGLMQSDGHCSDTGDCFDTTSPHLPGQLQQLCLHLGFAANIGYTYGPEQRLTSYGDKPLTRTHVIRRCLRPEVNKWAGAEGKTFWIEGWSGEVFCAEVPNNTLYVRRNGTPVWSGNSVLEHAVFTLLFTGISRTLTHELLRHRVGMSPSELSQRYVDCEDVAFVVPPAMMAYHDEWAQWKTTSTFPSGRATSFMRWINARRDNLDEYAAWTSRLSEEAPAELTGTERRKWARQAARSVLPNCTETKIVMTGNARSFRNVIEQRGSRHADAEIRRVAGAVYNVLLKEAPALFSDYTTTLLPDGSREITTTTRKI